MFKLLLFLASVFFLHNPCNSQQQHSSKPSAVEYNLYIDTADLSYYAVEIKLHKMPATFQLAMMAHPEYDDRFWRYVENIKTNNGKGTITRTDSALWTFTGAGMDVEIRYEIHPPASQTPRPSWRAFLTKRGGLVGGPHSFMYLLNGLNTPCDVTLDIPENWDAATGLELIDEANKYHAANVSELMDMPVLVGELGKTSFEQDHVIHEVAILPGEKGATFDTTAFVHSISLFTSQAKKLMGKFPYKKFTFLFIDDAYAGLEHSNSVNLGINSNELAKNVNYDFEEIAHEFFHTWNLVYLKPLNFNDVVYKNPALAKELWWSEGLTLYYAYELTRRAGLPTADSSWEAHLQQLFTRYFENTGNWHLSAEKVSLAANAPGTVLGDYNASAHTQGEVIGIILNIIISQATNKTRSIDDVMRIMMNRFGGKKGFTSKDIETIISKDLKVPVTQFFKDHIYGNKAIDVNKYLSKVKLRVDTTWKTATNDKGEKDADMRIYAYQQPDEKLIRLGVLDPSSCWAKAGLHSGFVVQTFNGTAITNPGQLRQMFRSAKIGDAYYFEVLANGVYKKVKVIVAEYKIPEVRVIRI